MQYNADDLLAALTVIAEQAGIVDLPRVAKADLVLCRVDVHIDCRRGQFEEENEDRMAPVKQDIAVCLPDGMSNQFVVDDPTIDVEVLLIGLTAGVCG